jgi:adenine-specific DNA-methyltransferase
MIDAGFGNKKTAIGQRRYLGSKSKLLTFIDEVLTKEKVEFNSFADIFSGTGVVASYFHSKSHIVVNDILESNYLSYQAYFGKSRIRTKWLGDKLKDYNRLDTTEIPDNYFSINFSNTYFDETNSKLIGHIREDIENLYLAKEINQRERAYLITALIYALDRIANTVGHYDAYRKVDMPTRQLELRPLLVNKTKYSASLYKTDANELVRQIKSDVVYIDPPYNSRQYSDAYHLLENIAEWQKQPVHGVAKKIDRSHIKSAYSLKSAGYAFGELINAVDAKYILVSYNDMGTSGDARSQSRISDQELISALESKGEVVVYEKRFNQFTTGKSKRNDLKERIFFCRVKAKQSSKFQIERSKYNMHVNQFVKSPLNYTGGKYKLLPQLTKFWPRGIDVFYDVFCGGANVGINAEASKIVCIDKSREVIGLLKLIQKTNYEELNQRILGLVSNYGLSQSFVNGYDHYSADSSAGLGSYNKQPYLKLRSEYNQSIESENKTLLLLVLILYGFNNQIRFNSKSEFNLPVGKRDYNGSNRRNLANFNSITNTKNVEFIEGDFRDINRMKIGKQNFIYFDPPYSLGLASYNESGGWSEADELDLFKTITRLHKKNIRFALSNVVEHKGETNRLLLDWVNSNKFKINFLKFDYKNSNYQSRAKLAVTKEVLITNY